MTIRQSIADDHEPIAYLNGQFVPISQAALSVFDLGIVAGASATEMVRTFRHVPFRLPEHLRRLEQSLRSLRLKTRQMPVKPIAMLDARIDHVGGQTLDRRGDEMQSDLVLIGPKMKGQRKCVNAN